MVQANAIERITSFIEQEQLVQMKKWSERYGAGESQRNFHINKIIKQIRNVLIIVSGNDIVAMLKGRQKNV